MVLRKLCAKDIFPMIQIMNKIGFKNFKESVSGDTLKDLFENFKDSEGKDSRAVGIAVMMEFIPVIVDGLCKAEQEIYNFMAGLAGVTAEEISNLPPNEFIGLVVDLIQKDEFLDFFKQVSRLFK